MAVEAAAVVNVALAAAFGAALLEARRTCRRTGGSCSRKPVSLGGLGRNILYGLLWDLKMSWSLKRNLRGALRGAGKGPRVRVI